VSTNNGFEKLKIADVQGTGRRCKICTVTASHKQGRLKIAGRDRDDVEFKIQIERGGGESICYMCVLLCFIDQKAEED